MCFGKFTYIELGIGHLECKSSQESKIHKIDCQIDEVEQSNVSGPFPAKQGLHDRMQQ